jgi:hypothetical protein
MKKLLIFCIVITMTQYAFAIPCFRIAPEDAKDHYMPSEWITIQLVDENVRGFAIDAITDNGGLPQLGVAGSGHVNVAFGYRQDGEMNYEGMLAAYVAGESTTVPPTPVSGVLYSFEYHLPDVPLSTIVTIGTFYDDDLWLIPYVGYIDGSYYEGDFIPAVLHLPEPATLALLGLGALMLRRRK